MFELDIWDCFSSLEQSFSSLTKVRVFLSVLSSILNLLEVSGKRDFVCMLLQVTEVLSSFTRPQVCNK